MSEGRCIRRRFGCRFGNWFAVIALFAQIVVVAVHCPAPLVFASPPLNGVSVVSPFDDHCEPSGGGAAPFKPAKPDHGVPSHPLTVPCPICTTLLQIVATLSSADIVVFPPTLASALIPRASPDHLVLQQTTNQARPRAPPRLA